MGTGSQQGGGEDLRSSGIWGLAGAASPAGIAVSTAGEAAEPWPTCSEAATLPEQTALASGVTEQSALLGCPKGQLAL